MSGLVSVRLWFTHLQVVEDSGEHVGSGRAGRVAPGHARRPTGSRPLAALVVKELALQQSLLAITALATVIWLIDWRFNDPAPHQAVTFAVTLMHGVFVALLAGAVASAEERRLGTLSWQLLQPTSGRRQWLVKAGVAMGLALGLAVGLPQIIAVADPAALSGRDWAFVFEPVWAGLVLGLTAASLYVSSLSGNGLQAMLVAMPVNLLLWSNADQFTLVFVGRRTINALMAIGFYPVVLALTLLAGAGYLLLMRWFGGVNHQSSVRDRRRVGPQILTLILYPLLAGLAMRQLIRLALN